MGGCVFELVNQASLTSLTPLESVAASEIELQEKLFCEREIELQEE